MNRQLSKHDAALLSAISQSDVMDAAGRLIANPRRAMVSLAEQVAMAIAVEQLTAIAIEADVLVRALSLADDDDLKAHAIETQLDTLRALLADARGETNTDKQETYNAD